MKWIHTADLHIGRSLHGFDLLEDQRKILEEILSIAVDEKADGLLLAGDIYDRAVPSAEAVRLFDDFLTAVHSSGMDCYIVSGNHDSGDRLSFAGRILEEKNIYIESSWKQGLTCVQKQDSFGKVCIWLLPFLRPAAVKALKESSGDESGEKNRERNGMQEPWTAQDAVKWMLSSLHPDPSVRNLLVTHYFVTAEGSLPMLSDSEQTLSVGSIDCVDASLFEAFDYTALGHLHGPQRVGSGKIRYAGSPLKYSFSEASQKKSVNVVEFREKGNVTVRTRELHPLHDVRIIQGTMEELMDPGLKNLANPEDYIRAVLTNEEELVDPMGVMKGVYPNLCEIIVKKHLLEGTMERTVAEPQRLLTDEELFAEFYETVTEKKLNQKEDEIVRWMLQGVKEESV